MARYVLIRKETTFGTAPSDLYTAGVYLKPTNVGINKEWQVSEVDTIVKGFGKIYDEVAVNETGEIGFFIDPISGLYFLNYAIGNNPTPTKDDTTNPIAYKYTMTPNTTLQPFTLEMYNGLSGGKAMKHVGCVITGASIELRVKQNTASTFNIRSRTHTLETAQSPASNTFKTVDKRFRWYNGSISIGGSTSYYVNSLSMEIDNDINEDEEFYAGDMFFGRNVSGYVVERGSTNISLDLELKFKDMTEYERFLDDDASNPTTYDSSGVRTGFPVVITFTGGSTGSSVAGYENYKMTFTLPKVKWASLEDPIEGSGEVSMRIRGNAEYDDASGYMIQTEIITTESSIV